MPSVVLMHDGAALAEGTRKTFLVASLAVGLCLFRAFLPSTLAKQIRSIPSPNVENEWMDEGWMQVNGKGVNRHHGEGLLTNYEFRSIANSG